MTDWPGTPMGQAWPGQPVGNDSSSQENQDTGKLSWSDVPGKALENAPGSAGRFLSNMAQPFLHPIDTAKNIGRLGLGAAEKAGISPTSGHEQYAEQAWKGLVDRYGGMDQIKKTIAEDPVGFAGDLSMLFTGGETALARLPGAVGEIGEAAGTVGRAINPLALPAKAVEKSGEITRQVVGNIGTGSGAEGIKGAYEAGKTGGAEGDAFRANMRDPEVHQSGIVAQARKALNDVRAERSQAYQKGMAAIGKQSAVLKFDDIDNAMSKASGIKSFKGIDISPSTAKVRKRIEAAIAAWKRLPPGQFHTPAGLDALKQYVGDIKDSLEFNTPERKVAEEAYGAIRNTIVKQAPEYADVMKDYEQASTLIDELSKTLSLGKKASEDTALRKLLSTTRSNVNTNFGKRADLAKELGKRDPTLVPSLAGQSLSTWTPQGLIGKGLAGGLGAGATYAHNPLMAAGLPFTSPRLVGEASHGLGRLVGKIPPSIRDALKRIDPERLKQLLQSSQLLGRAPPQGGQ